MNLLIDWAWISRLDSAIAKEILSICGQMTASDVKAIMPSSGGRSPAQARRAFGNRGERGPRGGPKTHQPSPPGFPPAVDTGRLRASISFVFTGEREIGIGSDLDLMRDPKIPIIGTIVDYGAHLEFGTQKMEARPYLKPIYLKYYGNDQLINRAMEYARRSGRLQKWLAA